MEKKKKEQKVAASSTSNQETETNDPLSNGEQNTPNVALDAENARTGSSPFHENGTSINQQYPPIVQWTYMPQHVEQSSLNSRPYVSTQSLSPVVVNHCQQLSHLQQNSASNHVQQGQPPLHLGQSTVPFWLSPQPGYQFCGVNLPTTFQTFNPIGTINGNWQGPAVIGGGTSSSNKPQVPNLCYPVGYQNPGFPGQQLQLHSMYAPPGGYGYFSSMPGSSASVGQSCQTGFIRPVAKLSQKHRRLWEAQSAENVQLRTVVGQLQSELADYKSRLMKLEEEMSSLKPAGEKPIAQVTGAALSGQPSKRGRPRKSAISVDVLPSPDECYPRARGRKPAAISKVQSFEARTYNFEKVILNKVEDKEKSCHSHTTTWQENDTKIFKITNSCGNTEVNGKNMMMPALSNRVNQENPRIQIFDKADDSFSILSDKAKAINTKAPHIGTTANGSFGWPSNSTPQSCGRNVLNMISQDFNDNSSVIRQGEKHIPGWNFVNGENASQLEAGVDDNEEEMGDDGSSNGEESAPTKDEGASYPCIVRWH